MILIINDPNKDDYKVFHKISTESKWQKEFLNYRNISLNEMKNNLNYWIENKQELFPAIFRMIRVTNDEYAESWNSQNSELIGFIAYEYAGTIDSQRSGLEMVINFAISEKYEGHNIMTNALEMTIEKFKENNYYAIGGIVKPGNIGSERIFEKCGFYMVRDNVYGKVYARPIIADILEFKNIFRI